MRQASRGVFGWLSVLGLLAEAALDAANKPVEAEIGTQPSLPPTCPARSVNYITESLPQQCLKTPWPKSENVVQPTSAILLPASGKLELVHTNTQLTTVTATLVSQNDSPPIPLDSATFSLVHASFPSAQSQIVPSPSTPGISPQKLPAHEDESDGDHESPLDNANFLSFEDWKRQNLAKAGQSPDNVGSRDGQSDGEIRRRPGSINNALDSLGEDTEIEIDFDGFANLNTVSGSVPAQEHSESKEDLGGDDGAHKVMPNGGSRGVHPRGKDAGKTCKERFNHASFDCAATVLKTNTECKGSTSVLVENKDSYMLNECSAKNKFFIVELCNDILVDTVVLANFEFFSSMFRTFRVSVSDRYPVKLEKWRELGTFEARNSREVQAFLVETPLIWARYLRIEFLTHFGNEYFCPVSLLRVHGTTMMEEFNHDVKGSKSEDDPESDLEESEIQGGRASDIVTAENLKRNPSSSPADSTNAAQATPTPSEAPPPMPISKVQDVPATDPVKTAPSVHTSLNPLLRTQMDLIFLSNHTAGLVCDIRESTAPLASPAAPSVTSRKLPEQSVANERPPSTSISSVVSRVTHTSQPASESGTPSGARSGAVDPTEPIARGSVGLSDQQNESTSSSLSTNRSSPSASRTSTSATGPPPSNPTTQESFFKSVHKRLQLLESNSTLSLQYIEEQSRILRDAFTKVEKRQLSKTTTFLESLNTTVLTEMRDFRNQYDQLWQSTVLELSSQRAQNQQEIVALSSRLTVLANEVVFQKRIAILQFLLILVCLGLVLFSRSSSPAAATFLELPPVVQNALNKSSTSLSRYAPHFDTPPASPSSSTRPPSRYGLFHRGSRGHDRGLSDGSALSADEGRKSPGIEYSPPTPVSQHSSDTDNLALPSSSRTDHLGDESPEEAQDARQTRSSPATPSGTREEKRTETVKSDYLRPD
ncbi:MAG: hypothetical protein Q9191_004998 [Dirinaria sp. TL-2023a]